MNNNRQYARDVKALAAHASMMTVEGLQAAILEDWNDPKWPSNLFDGMNLALEKKMGKRAYTVWFESLPVAEKEVSK